MSETVLVLDGSRDPLDSGRLVLPRRWPMLRETDGPLFQAYGSRLSPHLPRVVERRSYAGIRSARTVTTHFRDDFAIGLSFSVRGPRYLETVSAEGEWYCLSIRSSGDTVETVNGLDHRLGAGSCYLVRYADGMTHVLRAVTDEPLAEACVMFRPAVLAEKLGISRDELIARLHPDAGDPWYSDCRMTPEMERVVHDLRSRTPADPVYRLFAEAKTLELVALYMTRVGTEAGGHRAPAYSDSLGSLAGVRAHLERHYADEVSIEDLCRLAGLGRRWLTTAFKREYGVTIGDYMRGVRIEVAKALLRDPDLSVSDVAARVGYGYPANFAKVFRHHVGVSPRTYRRDRIAPSL
jgi:AraC-like DNA-binding protein